MLDELLTERRNPLSDGIDTLPTEEMLRVINAEDAKVAAAVQAAIPAIARAVDLIADRLRSGGRLFYIGAGTSGRLGVLDASECPPTFSVAPELVQGIIAGGPPALMRATEASEDDPAGGAADLEAHGFTGADVLAGIAASGRTPYVLGAMRHARSLGASTIGISCTSPAELSQVADVAIEVLTGPEIVTGSTRMKAGTATKLALNMLTTGAMVRLGYVYGNLMVNVQQRNEKLRHRARRIVRDAADVSDDRAADLLARGGDVKTAIVMGKLNVDRPAAEEMLRLSDGNVRKALELTAWKS